MASYPPLAFGSGMVPLGVAIGLHTPHAGTGLHYSAAIKAASRKSGILAALNATGVRATGVQLSFARVLPR